MRYIIFRYKIDWKIVHSDHTKIKKSIKELCNSYITFLTRDNKTVDAFSCVHQSKDEDLTACSLRSTGHDD